MICRKNIAAVLLITCLLCGSQVFAVQFGGINKTNSVVDYSAIDKSKTLSLADKAFENAVNESNSEMKSKYLQEAGANYYILTQADLGNIYPIIQLGKVYDLQKQDRYAKVSFSAALGINPFDKTANYCFGDFYYKRNQYGKALEYYYNALKYGYEENPEILQKMAVLYEKLGDLQKANLYYKKSFLINPQNVQTADKIREIEQIKYNKSDYYRRKIK